MNADPASANFLVSEAQLALENARKAKSDKTKNLGAPIQLTGIALAIEVLHGDVWIAENTSLIKRVDLESGKTLQTFRGHTGPATSLVLYTKKTVREEDGQFLITGSWDKTIKLWDRATTKLISSTDAHDDFVKSLLVFSSLSLLVSGSSDKTIRFWDISFCEQSRPLLSMGSISSHLRPIECLAGKVLSDTSALLYTADTMGVVKLWHLEKEHGLSPRWRSTLKKEMDHHRTRINEMHYGLDHLWTASADETVQSVSNAGLTPKSKDCTIRHPLSVRTILPLFLTDLAEPYVLTGSGDVIRLYDVSSPEEPELISEIDAHWHDVISLRLWIRKSQNDDKLSIAEPWIVSTSLDGTVRKWRLDDLLNDSMPNPTMESTLPPPQPDIKENKFALTEEEEQELSELLDLE